MGGSCVPPSMGLRWMAVRGSQGIVSEAAGGQRRPDGAQASWAGHRSCCGNGPAGGRGRGGSLVISHPGVPARGPESSPLPRFRVVRERRTGRPRGRLRPIWRTGADAGRGPSESGS